MTQKTLAASGLLAICACLAGAPALAQDHPDNSAAYEGLHARYAADRAGYHRGVWPDSYLHWTTLEETNEQLINAHFADLDYSHEGRVDYVPTGTVKDIARAADGHIEALYIRLFNGKGVWIDQPDIRYDRGNSLVMTNIDRGDLDKMADEQP